MLAFRPLLSALFAGFIVVLLPSQAFGQRDVLLNVCNDAGFSVAVAAAYRTSPTDDRTLLSWFMIEPGRCLEGAVNNVVGGDLDLHVMSGEWRWPARAADAVYCTPADSTFALATTEPCRESRQPRDFVRLPISSSRYRGLGQVDYRVRCEALSGADASMCVGAPRDERGMAQLVRTLEVCYTGRGEADTVVFAPRADGAFDIVARRTLSRGDCEDLYRGFPQGNLVLVGAAGRGNEDAAVEFCLPDDAEGPVSPMNGRCDAGQRVGAEMHAFRANVSRFTAYLQ